jgi:plastocyanin
MNKIVSLIAVVVVLGGGWYLLRSNNVDVITEQNGSPAGIVEENSGINDGPAGGQSGATNGAVKEFTVTGSSFAFSPKTITVNKGDTVKINFVNSVGFHDWVLDAFNVRTPQINAGQSASVTFVADKTGTFEYYCSVGTHRQMGMVGTLTVK